MRLMLSAGALWGAVLLLSGTVTAQSLSDDLVGEDPTALAKSAREDGSAVRGAILFNQATIACAKCHAPGKDLLGPDLTTMDKEATDVHLVESLLLPSKVIKEGFESVIVVTSDGKMITGRVVERTPQRLVLDDPTDNGQRITLTEDDLDEVEPSEQSIMPDGLVDEFSGRQDFLDIVKYTMELAAGGPAQSQQRRPLDRVDTNVVLSDDMQGMVLLGQLSCLACHADESSSEMIRTGQGPDLSDAGGRINPHYLERFIADPANVKPGTTMPDMMTALDVDARRDAARSITHYLVSLGSRKFQPQSPDRIAVPRGRELFHSVGCVACHSPRNADGSELFPADSVLGDSMPLGRLEEKYNVDGLLAFLKDPHSVRPSGRMPNMQLSHWEARDITHYLLEDVKVAAPLRYTVYQGDLHQGLDRLAGKQREAGVSDGFTLAQFADYRDSYAVAFQGLLRTAQPGRYTFYLKCDDAGRLSIDGKELIALDANADVGARVGSGQVTLAAGNHAIELIYLQVKNDQLLDLRMEGPGLEKGPVLASMLSSENDPIEPFLPFQFDPALVAQGKRQFDELGCIQCHAIAEQPSERSYLALSRLRKGQGCLSNTPGDWPHYQLSESQRTAIHAALARKSTKLTDKQRVSLDLTTLNCVACHRRGGLGGVSGERNEYFATDDHNLGEQGRIPPPLTDVGAKLQPKWMRDVLVNGRTIRPYMKTRMPQYGEENVAHLVDLFERIDQIAPVEFPPITDQKEMRQVGVEIAGSLGMNCVACHMFKEKPSETMAAVDLVQMAERLKKDWFYHYMIDPQRFSSNTVMPSFWPGGRSIRNDVLDGDTTQQVEALWQYLLDGRQARTPRGLVREPLELVVAEEAVMLRRAYNGIGKRGIGVGYPGQVNLAFDAEQMRLAMIWKGKFADPGGVWGGQGSGTVRPSGTDLIRFPVGPELDDATKPWFPEEVHPADGGQPADGGRPPHHQFKGYYLDSKRRPMFMYRFENIDVEDYPVDVKDQKPDAALIRRTLTFTSDAPRPDTLFRAAADRDIVAEADGRFLIGKTLRIRVDKDHRGQIVATPSGKQLLIPIDVSGGKSILILQYTW